MTDLISDPVSNKRTFAIGDERDEVPVVKDQANGDNFPSKRLKYEAANENSSSEDSDVMIRNSVGPLDTEEDERNKHEIEPVVQPLRIARDRESNKYIYPEVDREATMTARRYLKHYGLQKFLDAYLPQELNSLYIHYLIRMLGFEVKERELVEKVNEHLIDTSETKEENLTFSNIDDPLEKKYVVRLIKDLQKAINKVLSTRLRLTNFYTVDHFVERLQSARNILVLPGAGVSTSLGIPDFRSSQGFYSKVKHLGLDDPQDVFNMDIFMQDPSIFYNIAHMVLPPDNIYSPLHSFIKMLQDKGKLLRNYTQNIDNLESNAGIEADKLVQCHGSFATASCITCHWQLPGSHIFENIRKRELPLCPYCYQKRREYFPTMTSKENEESQLDRSFSSAPVSKSYGVLKPDITFFGEALPSKFHKTIRKDITKCDLLICIGTSLKVAPVSEIVNMIPANVPQILINRDPVKHAEFDLNLLGYCDDVAALVAQKSRWEIPHEKWTTLKDQKFLYEEIDKGTYKVEAQ